MNKVDSGESLKNLSVLELYSELTNVKFADSFRLTEHFCEQRDCQQI